MPEQSLSASGETGSSLVSHSTIVTPGSSPTRWVLEPSVLFLVLLVLGTYVSRMGALPIRGEESRRGAVAAEMAREGNWIVPRFQGDPLFMSSRPPLQAWTIALAGTIRGQIDTIAVRLPSVMALLGVVILLYWYTRHFLSETGAMIAAAGYTTMGQVLELGRLGESDLLFTFFVSGSLLLWHGGLLRGWQPISMWMLAYACAACATLTKGPQAPVYFAASIGTYLLCTGQWKLALSRSHALGILTYVLIWGSWQLAFYWQMGIAGVRHIYLGDVLMYGQDRSWLTVAHHLATYPLEVFCGCLMPWSILLLCYANHHFYSRLGSARLPVLFVACCLLVTFPTVWFVTGARTRFYMPLYPCVAILVGIAAERCLQDPVGTVFKRFWSHFISLLAAGALTFGGYVCVASIRGQSWFVETPAMAIGFAVVAASVAIGLFLLREGRSMWEGRLAAGIAASFIGLSFCWVATNSMQSLSVDKVAQMALLKSRITAGTQLYSLGTADHAFVFLYAEPIKRLPLDVTAEELPADCDFICFRIADFPQPDTVPLPYELVGSVTYGRNLVEDELPYLMVVGRVERDQSPHSRPTTADVIANYTDLARSARR
jgi:4-amino-4-deoxy-L-arabinose transferase-like glycosyltransferase